MAKKLISYDDQKPGLGLPDKVEEKLDAQFPSIDQDGKIRENHLPSRLSDAEIAKALGQYRGTGFPEGKVTAPVGSIYTDTDATAGAIRWIKTTGTGNTGWEVEYGDTGKRLLPKSLYSAGADQYAAADHSLWARRYNDTVYFGGYFRLTEEQRDVVEVPAGFEFHALGVVLSGSNTAGIDMGAMNASGGSFRFLNPKAPGGYLIAPVAIPAVSSWPVSLPGTPI